MARTVIISKFFEADNSPGSPHIYGGGTARKDCLHEPNATLRYRLDDPRLRVVGLRSWLEDTAGSSGGSIAGTLRVVRGAGTLQVPALLPLLDYRLLDA